jgi:zinc protease
MLNNIAAYDLPFDYVKQREDLVRNMSIEEHKELAREYIDPNVMTYVVVGDAKTQLGQLKQLGLGNPILVDREGNPL